MVVKDIKNMIRRKDLILLGIYALGGKCMVCGSRNGLMIHHETYNSNYLELSKIVIVCASCHVKSHKHKIDLKISEEDKERIDKIQKELQPIFKGNFRRCPMNPKELEMNDDWIFSTKK